MHACIILMLTGTIQLVYTLCLAVVLTTVINSTSMNMSYCYHQTSMSDFEQQLDYSKTHSGYVLLACH